MPDVRIKDTFLNALDRLREVSEEIEGDSRFIERAADYRAEIADFRVLIPLVGSFNAGKTSLVNAWLERPEGAGLPTDIVPQTALATEIHLTDSAAAEGVELYGKDDRLLRRIDLAEFQRVEKQTLTTGDLAADYAKATVRAPTWDAKEWSDWKVLVDMPGLDSGLRTHNAAIQRYLPLGSYFILVVDVEHGALRASEIGQLHEFFEREVEFVVLVNKIDKKRNAVAEVLEHVKQQVRQALGKSVEVLPVSAHAPDVTALRKVIDDVDFERALRNFRRVPILELFNDTIASLHTRYSALNVSSAERERTVAELEEEQQALEEKLRDDEKEVHRRYSDQAVDRIVRSARNAIRDHAGSLAQTLQSGGRQAYKSEINELVRRTLNQVTGKELRATLEWIDERYSADLGRIDARHQQFLLTGDDGGDSEPRMTPNPELLSAFAGRVRGAAEASARAFDQGRQRVAGATTAYTATTGILAAATSVVAPWLEVVIIALPTIFNWLSRKAEEQRREQQLQSQMKQLQSEISSKVASGVASELRERVAVDFASKTKEMIEELRRRVQGKIDQIKADIDKSRDEIENQRREVEQSKDRLRSAISQLTEARQSIAEI